VRALPHYVVNSDDITQLGEKPPQVRPSTAAMRIIRALLHPRERLPKALRFWLKIIRALFVFEEPRPLIRHYFNGTSPLDKRVRLRNGKQLLLSRQGSLDMIVLFQVFCEKVYPIVKNTVVLDVGANIGLFSLFAAFSGARRVYAFEPNREAYQYILENIRQNNLQDVIIAYNYAVTSRSHEVVAIPRVASPMNRIIYGRALIDEYESVNTISVDDIVSNDDISHVDLLKMDCEGSEYDILAGMSESAFSRIDRIIVEYHDGKPEEIDDNLKRHGFKQERKVPETEQMGMLWFRKS
jgi:FkbM family methyltransferase